MKTLKNLSNLSGVAALLVLAGTTSQASAQALSPMRQLVNSYSDVFAVRVTPKNPYQHRIRMEVRVYDHNFNLIKARVSPRSMMLGAGAGRTVTVMVPFEGKTKKRVRICAESVPFPRHKTKLKARVCGKFLATRVK
jgi:hypothetical protein